MIEFGYPHSEDFLLKIKHYHLPRWDETASLSIILFSYSEQEDKFILSHVYKEPFLKTGNMIVKSNNRIAASSYDDYVKIWNASPPYDLLWKRYY